MSLLIDKINEQITATNEAYGRAIVAWGKDVNFNTELKVLKLQAKLDDLYAKRFAAEVAEFDSLPLERRYEIADIQFRNAYDAWNSNHNSVTEENLFNARLLVESLVAEKNNSGEKAVVKVKNPKK